MQSKATTKLPESASWDEGVAVPEFAPLAQALEVDVAIIGGGLTGITAAYLLSEAGVSVAVFEKDRLGFGATGATTAFLTQYIDTAVQDLLTVFGRERTQAIFGSHREAITRVEQIIQREHIECECRRCPLYVYADSEKDWAHLQSEAAAGESVGMPSELRQDGTLPFENFGYLETAHQAKFHPRKYLAALVPILQQRGVRMYEETEIEKLEEGSPVVLHTSRQKIRARHVLVATYAPLNRKLFFKKAHYTSYVYEATLPPGVLPEGIYEDTADPYHYFRVDRLPSHDRLIVGGEDHRSDFPIGPEKNFQALEAFIHKTFSNIPYTLTRRWKGPILETVDGLAYIGPVDEKNIFYATGFSGNGMTYSLIAAQAFADFVLGRENVWLTLYDAKRLPALRSLMHKGRDYSKIMLGGAIKNTFTQKK